MSRQFYLGIGYQHSATLLEILAAAQSCYEGAGLTAVDIAAVATLDRKIDDGMTAALAEQLGCTVHYFTPAALEAETPRLQTPSDLVFREIGCHGVAEAAALAAAGPDANLIIPRTATGGITCAIARRLDDGR